MKIEKIIDIYSKGMTAKAIAKRYELDINFVKKAVAQYRAEEKEYTKELVRIRLALPRHKDELADQKWAESKLRFS